MGTLRWHWADDTGKRHTFKIPKSYYVPSCELRLLSPQHWAQTRNAGDQETTRCITSSTNVYLRWTQGEEDFELTLPLNKRGSNVGTLYSHPGYNKYDIFCQAAAISIADDRDPVGSHQVPFPMCTLETLQKKLQQRFFTLNFLLILL